MDDMNTKIHGGIPNHDLGRIRKAVKKELGEGTSHLSFDKQEN